MIKNGSYKLKVDRAFRCGNSCFSMRAGSVVKVLQIDNDGGKVLLHFGGRDMDWFHNSIMQYLELVSVKFMCVM